MARTLAGRFPDRMTADRAVVALEKAGFDPSQIGLISREQPPADPPLGTRLAKSTLGAIIGGLVGGTLGAIAGLIILAFALNLGHAAVGGIIAISVCGGVIGWVIGGITHMGAPIEEAEYQRERVEGGRMLLTLNAEGREAEARQIMRAAGAEGFQRPEREVNAQHFSPPAQEA